MIRLTIPSIEEDDIEAMRKVLSSGYLVQGARVTAFEQAVANYVGSKYAIAVSNCTAALHLALLALDVGPGDMVLVTAYSWPSTANVIELCGARPVFVDIRPDTFNMDPECLEAELKRLMNATDIGRRVKGIIPVHTFGQMVDMQAVLKIADAYNLPVIEDAACALGSTLNGQHAGTWGVMGCFSFHPRKAVTTGEGGIITTNATALARRLRALRNHGQAPDTTNTDFIMPGFNFRMTEFQAALGVSQMTKLNRIISTRRRLAAFYDDLLQSTPIQSPEVVPGCQPVYQSYVTFLPENTTIDRDELIRVMKDKGIETTIGTWHIPMVTYFRTQYGYKQGDFPATDQVFARSLTLPLHEFLSKQEQKKVIKCLQKAMTEHITIP